MWDCIGEEVSGINLFCFCISSFQLVSVKSIYIYNYIYIFCYMRIILI